MPNEDRPEISYLSFVGFQRLERVTPIRFYLWNGLVAGDGLHARVHLCWVDYLLSDRGFALSLRGRDVRSIGLALGGWNGISLCCRSLLVSSSLVRELKTRNGREDGFTLLGRR